MEKVKAYSLWLMPMGDTSLKLAHIISQLSKNYSAPSFEPHVTLLNKIIGSEEEIIKKTAQAASILAPYEILLTRVGYLDEYFKCLFINVEKTTEVMNANAKAREVFHEYIIDRHTTAEYMPHLSLLYGNFSSQIKEEIIKKIGKEWNLTFETASIHLFSTEGDVKDWHKLKEFPLGR